MPPPCDRRWMSMRLLPLVAPPLSTEPPQLRHRVTRSCRLTTATLLNYPDYNLRFMRYIRRRISNLDWYRCPAEACEGMIAYGDLGCLECGGLLIFAPEHGGTLRVSNRYVPGSVQETEVGRRVFAFGCVRTTWLPELVIDSNVGRLGSGHSHVNIYRTAAVKVWRPRCRGSLTAMRSGVQSSCRGDRGPTL